MLKENHNMSAVFLIISIFSLITLVFSCGMPHICKGGGFSDHL